MTKTLSPQKIGGRGAFWSLQGSFYIQLPGNFLVNEGGVKRYWPRLRYCVDKERGLVGDITGKEEREKERERERERESEREITHD
jgi:hypothetical protein